MKSTINNLISKHDPLKKWSGVLDFSTAGSARLTVLSLSKDLSARSLAIAGKI